MINSNKRKALTVLASILTVLVATFTIIAYESDSLNAYDLSEGQIAGLMEQYAENQELYYDNYLENGSFADCEFFGAEQDGDKLYVYAHILWGEYVKLDDMAYCMSGSSIPSKLTVDASGMKILDCEEPIDGDEYDSSLKKLFPRMYYLKALNIDYDKLNSKQEKRIEAFWDVEVDDDFQLEIDGDGKYKIIEITNDGSENPEDFESRIVKEGVLKPRISE